MDGVPESAQHARENGRPMGPEIIIPVVLLAIIVPTVLTWAKRNLREPGSGGFDPEAVRAHSERFTSDALRTLPTPPWRVIYEIAAGKLGGIEHVLIGPAGIYAIRTSMDPLPPGPVAEPSAAEMAESAIARSELDDALRRCAMSSDRMVWLHWGSSGDDSPVAVQTLPDMTAVNSHRLGAWVATLGETRLTPAQVDLAWQTVTTAIGRPDPFA